MEFEGKTDCWSVSLFDDLTDPNRFVSCGFSDGTVNLYDMRANKLFSSHLFSNSKGIVSLQFRKNSQDPKDKSLIVTTPNSHIHYIHLDQEKKNQMIEEAHHSTIWCK